MTEETMTHGHLLGGRVRYDQPAEGYRTGIEPVLLAAAVPAQAGDRVIEGGTGAGAGLLCLAARVPGIAGLGFEIEPAMVAIAERNFAANGQAALAVRRGDVGHLPRALPEPGPGFDHAMANPPWHSPAGTPSPRPLRARAKIAAEGLIAHWVQALAACLRHRGTLTLILPPHALPEVLAALPGAGCGSPRILPLWPKAGRPARLTLLQAVRGGRAELALLPGLVLHEGAGFSPAAQAVLRDAGALPLR